MYRVQCYLRYQVSTGSLGTDLWTTVFWADFNSLHVMFSLVGWTMLTSHRLPILLG